MATSPRNVVPEPAVVSPVQVDLVEHLIKLQKWSRKITSILDLDELINKIVDDVAAAFCCVETNIYLHDEARGELEMAGVHGCTLHGKGSRLKVGKDGMVGYVAATRQMRYAPDVRQDPYYVACEASTLSEVAIPLLVDGRLVGVFAASHHDLDAFSREHLRWLQGLCDHVAVAVHNARRFQQERHERERMSREEVEARAIQQALLPKSSPFIPGFAISGLSIPAGAVGGDWYDFISFDDGCWGLVLADVSGKGTAAALLMSATRGILRSLAQTCTGPGEILTRLNRLLVEDFPSGKFVTMLLAVLNPSSRELTFSSAGHLRPLLVDEHGARFLDSERGLPLGLRVGEFSESRVQLSKGSRLVFYSDGITEATGGSDEEYGAARMRDHVLQPDASADSILADVRAFANGEGLHDDATVIFLRA
ncbi:MAG TPA: GAF domain-containing SpoIIE family protein phosphatase [Terriglobales bacterium]|jgi:sigma-B regulation protein RsbU (phosphoserine phosphatase)|nr:GAF domain-containing SpoIIE family protein phosphatase [Terriglobales bacterium]